MISLVWSVKLLSPQNIHTFLLWIIVKCKYLLVKCKAVNYEYSSTVWRMMAIIIINIIQIPHIKRIDTHPEPGWSQVKSSSAQEDGEGLMII